MSTFSTTMVSLRPDGTTISGYDSVRPSISGDGRLVVYGTDAGDVVAGDGNGASDVILRDLTRGANVLVSATPSGTSGNGCSGFCPDSGPVLSSDGCTVAFTSFASDLVTGDGNGVADVFVRDLVGVRPLLLSRVEPATGSSAGGDLVHVIGCGFAPDAGVQFGAAAATVIDVRANRIRLRAPAGAGAVEVSVTGSTGSAQLAGAYAYLDPALAARLGNVHEGLGDREDVLDVDGSHGNGARELMLRVRQPIVVRLAAPSTRASARYCLYVWRGTPNTGTITVLPSGVGALVMPAPFSDAVPQPRAIFNNLGYASVLGAPTIPSTPAPAIVVSRASGSPIPIDVTLQGLIEDDGAANSRGVSLTNAMIVRVR
ncbi:MAG: IPT/TIG domain-containing protein [Planctomycetes bacterium]|nr:IPT/TIG domain-containing protein [Planctomycetota bacterium]